MKRVGRWLPTGGNNVRLRNTRHDRNHLGDRVACEESVTPQARAAARFISPARADFAMRGFAISFLTLARVASSSSFLAFFLIEHP
jgi:hypothetical protein